MKIMKTRGNQDKTNDWVKLPAQDNSKEANLNNSETIKKLQEEEIRVVSLMDLVKPSRTLSNAEKDLVIQFLYDRGYSMEKNQYYNDFIDEHWDGTEEDIEKFRMELAGYKERIEQDIVDFTENKFEKSPFTVDPFSD